MSVVNTEEARESDPGVDASLARPGGLSYLAIVADDVHQSAAFYEQVLGWTIDWRSPDDARFSDATGHLIGRFVAGSARDCAPGLSPYFYVERLDEAVERAMAHKGEAAKPPYAEGNLRIALVRDPAGNRIGLWQDASRE